MAQPFARGGCDRGLACFHEPSNVQVAPSTDETNTMSWPAGSAVVAPAKRSAGTRPTALEALHVLPFHVLSVQAPGKLRAAAVFCGQVPIAVGLGAGGARGVTVAAGGWVNGGGTVSAPAQSWITGAAK